MEFLETSNLEYIVDDVELRYAAAKTLKGFCLAYLPHHFPADLSDFFDELVMPINSALTHQQTGSYALVWNRKATFGGRLLDNQRL